MPKFIDLTNETFGRLFVLWQYEERDKFGYRLWVCLCECGEQKLVTSSNLLNGSTRSCGCLRKERPTRLVHGMSKTKEHHIWRSMIVRCYNSQGPHKDYGARGIKVCDRWLGPKGFENFFADMGKCPFGLTLERKDVNGDYNPDNCCWATREQQANNRRTSRFIEHNGEKLTFAQWERKKGLTRGILHYRKKAGWSDERALAPGCV
jgi:hypothetical protein